MVVVPALAGTVGHQAPTTKGVDVAHMAKTLKHNADTNKQQVVSKAATWQNGAATQKVTSEVAPAPRQQARAQAAAATSEGGSASSVQQLGHDQATGNAIIDIAMRYLGMPYVYGAAGPDAFDCSGFTQVVFGQVGISLPHQSEGQAAALAGSEVSAAEAQPGDLMWTPGHVGIYLGNGRMIHAATPSTGVTVGDVYTSFHYYRTAK
ncbi:NlpC/P60 family protein [Winkia neuii]|nr:NlpC/P60 family protein [Winkia neuii]